MKIRVFLATAILLAVALAPLLARADNMVSSCTATTSSSVEPQIIELGETTAVSLTTQFACAQNLHLVLVLDASGSMLSENRNRSLRQATTKFIETLELNSNPGIRVGIVKFNDEAQTLCKLTNDAGKLRSCVNKVDASHGTAIDKGIREGMEVLRDGRPTTAHEVLIVLTDGVNNDGCTPVVREAGSAKSQDVAVGSICFTSDCDVSCMKDIATSLDWFWEAKSQGELERAYGNIQAKTHVALGSTVISSTIPINMTLVTDSVMPPADFQNNILTWNFEQPTTAITLTYRVQPLEAGSWNAVEARGQLLDSIRATGVFTFPVAPIQVNGVPTPTPSTTPEQSTPSATPPRPTNTPEITETPTATPTKATSSWTIYLPRTYNEED